MIRKEEEYGEYVSLFPFTSSYDAFISRFLTTIFARLESGEDKTASTLQSEI